MKLYILFAGDKAKQVKTLNDAACFQYLFQTQCKLLRIDTVTLKTTEITIPEIEFKVKEGWLKAWET